MVPLLRIGASGNRGGARGGAVPELDRGAQEAIRRAQRAKLDALIEQLREDLRRCEIGEAIADERCKYGFTLLGTEGVTVRLLMS